MKFITNKISTSKSSDFSDFVKKLADSNPSLLKTSSTKNVVTKKANIANFGDKKAEPFSSKDVVEDKDKKTKDTKKEDSEEIEVVDKKEASSKPAAKKASNSDIGPKNKGVTHKVDECCGAPTSKSDDGSQGDKKSAPKAESKCETKEEKKEASAKKFVRIANLDSKTKNEWKKYWKNLYPTEYVEAMFADK